MESGEGRHRIEAALPCGDHGRGWAECVGVLEEFVMPVADGDDEIYGAFVDVLRGAGPHGQGHPDGTTALRTVRGFDRGLSPYRDYRAFLGDEELRAAIENVLALP